MKPPQKQQIHYIIFIFLLMVEGVGQDCDEGYVWINYEPWCPWCWDGNNCFYESDLDVCGICNGDAESEDECHDVFDIDNNGYNTVIFNAST